MAGNLFYGIQIENDLVKANLSAFVEQVRVRVPRATWTAPEKIHVTLQFIGNVPTKRPLESLARLSDVAAGSLRIGTLGFFRDPQKAPRVLFTELRDSVGNGFIDTLRTRIGAFGLFTSHLTLAKLEKRGDSAPEILDIVNEFKTHQFGYTGVSKVHLYRTIGGGQPYEIVATQRLQG